MRFCVVAVIALAACGDDYAYDSMAAGFSVEGDLAVVRAMAPHELACQCVMVEADNDGLYVARGCGERAQYRCSSRTHECWRDD